MDPLKLIDIQRACAEGQLHLPMGSNSPQAIDVLGISTDTRNLQPGEVFVALRGERFDGHHYLEQAIARGAVCLIVSDILAAHSFAERVALFEVPDTLLAYQQLAQYYRERCLQRIIAVTGSVGKTSTREMIACALQPTLGVSRTQGNLNNEIGVPSTLLQVRGATDVSIIEMGMDHAGDIRVLTKIAQPDLAVITGIGYSHIGNLGSREALFRAKAEIVEGLRPGGTLLLPAADPYLLRLAEEEKNRHALAFVYRESTEEERKQGRPDSPPEALPGPCLLAHSIELDEEGRASFLLALQEQEGRVVELLDGQRITLPIVGVHHVDNALFGLLCARLLDQPLEAAAVGLLDFTVVGDRQRLVDAAGIIVMNDSYNAAPESIQAALHTLVRLSKHNRGRAIAVLGGILELGELAETLHHQMGRAMASLELSEVYVCGPQAETVVQGCSEGGATFPCHPYPTREDLIDALLPALRDRDVVLVKGSHGFGMQVVCDRIVSDRVLEAHPLACPADRKTRAGGSS